MKKRNIFMLISLLAGLLGTNFVFSSEVKTPAGVQVSALGGAGAALVREEAVYYNPAALAFFEFPSLVTSWQRWYDFINKGQIIGILPCSKNMTMGIFDNYSSTGKIDYWNEANSNNGSYRFFSNLVSLSIGWRLMGNLSLGGTLKYLSEDTKYSKASSEVLGDLSLFTRYKEVLNMGINLQNIGDSQDSLVKAGISIFDRDGRLSSFPTIFSLDLNYPLRFKPYLSFGMETFLYSMLYFRLGYRTGPLDLERLGYLNGLTFGFGFEFSKGTNWQLDYAFVPNGDLGEMHQVGLGYKFGKELKVVKEEKSIIKRGKGKEGQMEAEILFQDSLKLIEQGDLLEATLIFEECLSLNPGHQRAKILLEEISTKLDKEVALEGQNSMIFQGVKEHYVTGINEYRKQNFEKAILKFNKVLENTFHPKTKKYLEQAKRHLTIRESRNQASLYFEHAENLVKEGRYVEAETKLEKSLELYPEYLSAKELLNQVSLKTKTEQKIKKHLNWGEKNFDKGQYEKALINFYHVLRLNPENERALQMIRGCGLKIIGEDKEKKISDKKRENYFKKGKNFCKEGDFKSAIYLWARIITSEPANIEVLKEIQRAYRKMQREKRKQEQQQFLKQQQEKERKEKIERYCKKAEGFYKTGKHNHSIEYWKKVLELDPENKQAKEGMNKSKKKLKIGTSNGVDLEVVEEYYKQGLIYYNQGKYQEAIIEWKKVLELDPNNEKAKANIKVVEEKMNAVK